MNANTRLNDPFWVSAQLAKTVAILFLAALALSGCAPKPPKDTHTIERIIDHQTDSVKFLQVNREIMDSLFLKIAKVETAKPECDSITQETVNQILRQLNSRKKSGGNEMGIYFDELKNQIIAWQKMAQTQNESTSANRQATVVKIEKQVVNIPVRYIPFWAKALAAIGGIALVFVAYRISRVWAA